MNMQVDLERVCKEVTKVSATAGRFILGEREKFTPDKIEKKGHNDLVSYVDKSAEEIIVKELKLILPEAGFITEEDTPDKSSNEYTWIIDPLDGTTNFIHGVPCYCISIALMRDKEVIIGVVHELNLDECFYAWKDGGTYLNGKRVHVSKVKELASSLLATGFPYRTYERLRPYMEIFEHCLHFTHGVRRMGSAAADLAYVSCGRFEAFYEYGLNPWDVAAGALLVKEAGGRVTDFSGGDDYVFGKEMLAGNPLMFDEFHHVVKEKFGLK